MYLVPVPVPLHKNELGGGRCGVCFDFLSSRYRVTFSDVSTMVFYAASVLLNSMVRNIILTWATVYGYTCEFRGLKYVISVRTTSFVLFLFPIRRNVVKSDGNVRVELKVSCPRLFAYKR